MSQSLFATAQFRDLQPLGDKPMPWNHMVPRGEFPGSIDIPAGYDVPGFGVAEENMSIDGLTVIGDEQLERIVQGFRGEMLIDPDHLSHDMSHSTEAMGWGHGIRYMPNRDGLEVETEWTPLGKEKILTKAYRFISPEFDGHVRYEDGVFKFFPTALTGAGLTNRPKLKALRPVSANRETNETNRTHMKAALTLLCGLIGAPETATEQELTTKVEAFKGDLATQKNRAETAARLEEENKKLKEEAINADLERFSDVIDDKDSAKLLFQANREAAVKSFTAIRAKLDTGDDKRKATETLYQRNRATPPDGKKVLAETEEEEKATAHFRAVSGRATQLSNEARAAGKTRDWNSCWAQAEGELAGKS